MNKFKDKRKNITDNLKDWIFQRKNMKQINAEKLEFMAEKNKNKIEIGTEMSNEIGMNAFNENERDYEQEVDQLEQARRQELNNNEEEAYQQVVALMSSGNTNMDRVNEYLKSVGLGDFDEEGNFIFGEKPESMSQADWTQLQYLYNLQNDTAQELKAQEEEANPGYAVYSSLDQLGAATYVKSSGNVGTLAGNYNEEIKVIWHHASNGDYQDGDCIKITNGQGETIYMQWTSNGFRMVGQSEYDNAGHQYTLQRGKNKNNIYNQVK